MMKYCCECTVGCAHKEPGHNAYPLGAHDMALWSGRVPVVRCSKELKYLVKSNESKRERRHSSIKDAKEAVKFWNNEAKRPDSIVRCDEKYFWIELPKCNCPACK